MSAAHATMTHNQTSMFIYILLSLFAWIVGLGSLAIMILAWRRVKPFKKNARHILPVSLVVLLTSIAVGWYAQHPAPLNFAMPPTMMSHAPGGLPASLPIWNVLTFLGKQSGMERVANIGMDPATLPREPMGADGIVHLKLTAKEVISEITHGVWFNYWTYNGTVPGPMLRVRN